MGYIDEINVGGIDSEVRDTGTRKTIAPTETTPYASKAYAKDAFFIWDYTDGKVYQATAAIAQGAQFIVGTNIKLIGDIGSVINQAVTDEVTARTSAISTEASTRAAADTALGTRIDQIVAPTGEAPNPAEITDARIGVDDVTYDNLGNAIRGQVGEARSALGYLTWLNDRNLVPFNDNINLTHRGVTFKSLANCMYHAFGSNTATAASNVTIFSQNDGMPSGITAGETYYATKIFKGTGSVTFRLYFYNASGSAIDSIDLSDRGKFVVPTDTTAIRIALYVSAGVTVDAYIGIAIKAQQDVRTNNQPILSNRRLATSLPEGTDLFTLTAGSYYAESGVGATLLNCPTTGTFRLEILERINENTLIAMLIDSGERFYITNRPATGIWHEWQQVMLKRELPITSKMVNSISLPEGTDLFTLTAGSYYAESGVGATLLNCPTTGTFRLEILERINENTLIAMLIDSGERFYITNRPATGIWHEWKRIATVDYVEDLMSRPLPDYYKTYMESRTADILKLEDEISENSDSFMFITDYHIKRNCNNSPLMIQKIVQDTGITKLFFGGDAYQTIREGYDTETLKALSRKNVAYVYSLLSSTTPEFFSVLGNHEWNHLQGASQEGLKADYEINLSGVYNYCLKRHELHVNGMTEEGNYYVDNVPKKIRYYFLQQDGDARVTLDTLNWFGNQLLHIPADYTVVVIMHFAFTKIDASTDTNTYEGRAQKNPKRISELLGGFSRKEPVLLTLDDGSTLSFDYTNVTGIGGFIISGHIHIDRVLSKNISPDGVLTIGSAGDLYKNGSGVYYTFVDAEGNTITREPETIYEQSFNVVHIDLDSRKVYITKMGGGIDAVYDY